MRKDCFIRSIGHEKKVFRIVLSYMQHGKYLSLMKHSNPMKCWKRLSTPENIALEDAFSKWYYRKVRIMKMEFLIRLKMYKVKEKEGFLRSRLYWFGLCFRRTAQ